MQLAELEHPTGTRRDDPSREPCPHRWSDLLQETRKLTVCMRTRLFYMRSTFGIFQTRPDLITDQVARFL